MTIRNLIQCDGRDCEVEAITEDGETTRDLIDRIHANGWATLRRGNLMLNLCPGCEATVLT